MDLGQLIFQIEGLGEAVHAAAERAAEKLPHVVEQQFAHGVDPYGRQWAPLKDGTRSHLTKSGAMRSSVRSAARGNTVTTTVDRPANFHQHGTSKMQARQVLPESGRPLPEAYRAAVVEAAREVLAEEVRRAIAA